MTTRAVLLCAVLALALSSVCCTKIPPPALLTGPSVVVTTLPAIPAEAGELVAVTPGPIDPHWVVLWFQKPDKTISVQWVNVTTGTIGGQVTIPRK